MSEPHGETLIDRVASESKRDRLIEEASEMKKIKLNSELRRDVHNIANGVYSPLTGFLGENDFENVIEHMRLSSDVPWTLPIVLDVDEEKASNLLEGEEVCLETEDGEKFAVIDIEEIYTFDKDEAAEKIYGTDDIEHPGVEKVKNMDDYLISGEITQFRKNITDFEK